jgi:hypothetical protein
MDAIPGLRDGLFFWWDVKDAGGRARAARDAKKKAGQRPAWTSGECVQARLMTPSTNEIKARTIKIWIIPPTLYTKTPKSHPINKMTAIKYNSPLIK